MQLPAAVHTALLCPLHRPTPPRGGWLPKIQCYPLVHLSPLCSHTPPSKRLVHRYDSCLFDSSFVFVAAYGRPTLALEATAWILCRDTRAIPASHGLLHIGGIAQRQVADEDRVASRPHGFEQNLQHRWQSILPVRDIRGVRGRGHCVRTSIHRHLIQQMFSHPAGWGPFIDRAFLATLQSRSRSP
ncbi:hypothetical protein BD311DRAFT_56963 [Dichomitus squalens]|uniref:Uncharacterized protein n=1 Tax=Dichomitus squalens TaxID=114155 RepID=A0A4Q9N0G5_9APHY|nr:hypothetical protein BD311DRAFT_56963 [Dichomitus squalens]